MSMSAAQILIAEDEVPLRNLVRMSLEAAGHTVTAVGDGQEALEAFAGNSFDLIILDIMMPRLDGFSVCEQIRRHSEVPIIMLTALGSTEDLVRGFELGADDYIPKPFTFKEVQARIHAVLRRAQWTREEQVPALLEIGRVRLDMNSHEAYVGGEYVHLTPIELKLLHFLMSSAGTALTKQELFTNVWGHEYMSGTNLVEVAVRRLREKVELDPSNPTHILTVRGFGYRFRSA